MPPDKTQVFLTMITGYRCQAFARVGGVFILAYIIFFIFTTYRGSTAGINGMLSVHQSTHGGDINNITNSSAEIDTVKNNTSSCGRGVVSSVSSTSNFTLKDSPNRVIKRTFSHRMRILFSVGLEGTGHHYVGETIKKMFEHHRELTQLDRCNLTDAYDLRKYEGGQSKYVEDTSKAKRDMRELYMIENTLPPEGGLVTMQGCTEVGWQSFPNFGGPDKALQYPDIRMLAEVAEAEEVDLRVVYLKRNAEEIMSSSIRRGFQR